MPEFVRAREAKQTGNVICIRPSFRVGADDLMIRGHDFYAVYNPDTGFWSKNEEDALKLIDIELWDYKRAKFPNAEYGIHVEDIHESADKAIGEWHKFCKKDAYDKYHELDSSVLFLNDNVTLESYATKTLPYELTPGPTIAWDELTDILYAPSEKEKIEWFIGSIVTGASKEIQKFGVFYGGPGTGKSTILNIIEDMFRGYTTTFDSTSLGSANSDFALEAFKSNPLIAIQHDGDMSHLETNIRINSIVSHETLEINEKFKSKYSMRILSLLLMGTNKPVRISDARSGLIRRLIDIVPTGNTIPYDRYAYLVNAVRYEYGAIAYKCKEFYMQNARKYDDYKPLSMMGTSNDFYNFMLDSYDVFIKDDSTTLKQAWTMYKVYCDDARVPYPLSMRVFKEELKSYFQNYDERVMVDGMAYRNRYSGFKKELFVSENIFPKMTVELPEDKLRLKPQPSLLDNMLKDCPAQYGNEFGVPSRRWENCTTTLADLDTSKVHYVKVPLNHIVIDFDLKNEAGEKSLRKNMIAASQWPATYAEVSQGGNGLHLHYLYSGDPTQLSRVYNSDIEIKVFNGNSSLRRKLTRCNDIPVATISAGLPLREEKKMLDFDGVENERHLRFLLKKALNKEVHANTAPNMDFIKMIIDKAYESGLKYDVTDMRPSVMAFAAQSSHQAEKCLRILNDIHWKSDEPEVSSEEYDEDELIFFDCEVFSNVFIVCWKAQHSDTVVRMIQPTQNDIENLLHKKLVGFNNKRYDNHILYAWLMGYNNEQLYILSQRLASNSENAYFSEAFKLSYTDIYDFAATKQSLKKWEIEIGIHHQEFAYPWNEPLPEDKWEECADYCENDVRATQATFEHLEADWTAREILAKLTGMTVNDSTNQLTAAFIFGKGNKKPQAVFRYRNLADPVYDIPDDVKSYYENNTCLPLKFKPVWTDGPESILPYFPGYHFDAGKSIYRGDVASEGGYVYAEPGIYLAVALLDIASMHPTSAECECSFGPEFTKRFHDLKQIRVLVKHKQFDEAKKLFDGALAEYLEDPAVAKRLAYALKIAINSVYGLTSARFENPFRDSRNKDNIIAKRGALFMIDLKNEVQKKGFTVVHIKTDSIKIANATPEIIRFIMDFGKYYGYAFEHEATYEKMCLVNDAVYIARYATQEWCEQQYGYIPGDIYEHGGEWTATGTQFAVPYVKKTLFTHEEITFDDVCETKQVTGGAIYLDKNESLRDVEKEEAQLKTLEKKLIKEGKEPETDPDYIALALAVKNGHDYKFVGRIGQFCPVPAGSGGGYLIRIADTSIGAVTGTKGQRWIESEDIRDNPDRMNLVDRSYYEKLVDDARNSIAQYGDVETFVA